MPRLKDVVCTNPKILFVGINPGFVSLEVGHHFAGKFNPFYELLHAARLVPVVLEAVDDGKLVDYGYALTNLVAKATKMSTDLRKPDLEKGRKALMKKLKIIRPKIIALVGVTLYPIVCEKPSKGGTLPGVKDDILEGARVFVLPNPSGRNANYSYAEMLAAFRRLRTFLHSRRGPTPAAS